jgi:hypothetical protein
MNQISELIATNKAFVNSREKNRELRRDLNSNGEPGGSVN